MALFEFEQSILFFFQNGAWYRQFLVINFEYGSI
jgi:hypothetical protein